MFFGVRKHRLTRSSGRASDGTDGVVDDTLRRQAQQLRDWRESAQRVARAWQAWLAADRSERASHYRAYEEALAAEERAAAQVERMFQLAAVGQQPESDGG